MNRRIRVAAVVVLLAVVAALMLRGGPASRPAAVSQRGQRVRWPEGKRFTYSLVWHAKTGGEVSPGQDGKASQSLAFESEAEGEVALERAGGVPSRQAVAMTITRFDKFSFSMQGQDAKGDHGQVAAGLVGQTAFLEVDERGRIGEIGFPPEMNPQVRAILRSLALELRYTLPETDVAAWEALERDSLGEVWLRYRASQAELLREPVSYRELDAVHGALQGKQEVRGGAVLSLDGSGVPLAIDETVGASYSRVGAASPAVQSSWTFVLHRTGEGRAQGLAVAAARAQVQPLGAQVADPDREKRRDERMAEGMSYDALSLAFDRFETGTRPGHTFLAKASAWLRLHPEELPALVGKFKSKELTVKGRGLILDVLAETGNAGAQKAMRDALSSDAARAKPHDFSILVQRFTFVIAPGQESIDFLEKELSEAKHAQNVQAAQGAAVALGSAVRRLDGQLEHGQAAQLNERLRADLRDARTPELRGALVAALGNAGRPEDVKDLVAVAGDPDVRVRDQVASALRTVDSADARAGLLSLAADPSSAVSISALGSLQKQTLGDSDWEKLAGLARERKTPAAADPALVELVRAKGAARAVGREILVKLLERNQGADSDLPAIIRHLLEVKQGG